MAAPRVGRICKQCGKVKLVPPSLANRPFCNRECMGDYYREHDQWQYARQSPDCGFKTGNNNPNWVGGLIKVHCANCDAELERKPSELERSEMFFCDMRCHGEWQRRTGYVSTENNPNWQGGPVETNCANCGESIMRTQHDMHRSERHFCNKRCHGEWDSKHKVGPKAANWRGGPVTDSCAWCGHPVERPVAWARRKGRECLAFCSKGCRLEHWAKTFSGTGNPNWKGGYEPYYGSNWTRQRRKARLRDKHICQQCGITPQELGYEVDVHHIRPFRLFLDDNGSDIEAAAQEANRLDNLICYCRSCHVIIERSDN